MPCNCGKKSGKRVFIYTSPSGVQTTYPTEVQAKAAQIRGQGGTIKPA